MRWRMYATLGLLAAAVAAVLFIPLPSHVYAPLEVQAHDAATVYVRTPGVLERVLIKPGDQVEKGELLAELGNIEPELLHQELIGQRDMYQSQLASLQSISLPSSRLRPGRFRRSPRRWRAPSSNSRRWNAICAS